MEYFIKRDSIFDIYDIERNEGIFIPLIKMVVKTIHLYPNLDKGELEGQGSPVAYLVETNNGDEVWFGKFSKGKFEHATIEFEDPKMRYEFYEQVKKAYLDKNFKGWSYMGPDAINLGEVTFLYEEDNGK